MKAIVTISVMSCGLMFVGTLGLLALASYHLWSNNDSGYIPMEPRDDWITNITSLIPVCVYYLLVCGLTLWTILTKDMIKTFIAILLQNFLCLLAAVYFSVAFANELGTAQMSGELLFNRTKSDISNNKPTWVPNWLDSVQKQSRDCCGILTYRDWEEFWPNSKDIIPSSCCRDPENRTVICHTDLSRIPFPGTPSMFLKVDTGCLDEINDQTNKNIQECFIYVVLLCCIIALAEVAYIVQFYLQFIPTRVIRDRFGSNGQATMDGKGQGDNQLGYNQNPTNIDSYLQMSEFTASLQTSSGSCQASNGIDPDTGDRAIFGMPITMDSYDPIALSTTASSSGLMARQRSLGRLGSSPQIPDGSNRNQNFGGPLNTYTPDFQSASGVPAVSVVSSSSDMDQFGKKKKSHRHRNDNNAGSNTKIMDQRQEIFIAPDTMDDFLVDSSGNGVSLVSPTESTDNVGDLLADGSASPVPAKDKKKFGLNPLNIKSRRHR